MAFNYLHKAFEALIDELNDGFDELSVPLSSYQGFPFASKDGRDALQDHVKKFKSEPNTHRHITKENIEEYRELKKEIDQLSTTKNKVPIKKLQQLQQREAAIKPLFDQMADSLAAISLVNTCEEEIGNAENIDAFFLSRLQEIEKKRQRNRTSFEKVISAFKKANLMETPEVHNYLQVEKVKAENIENLQVKRLKAIMKIKRQNEERHHALLTYSVEDLLFLMEGGKDLENIENNYFKIVENRLSQMKAELEKRKNPSWYSKIYNWMVTPYRNHLNELENGRRDVESQEEGSLLERVPWYKRLYYWGMGLLIKVGFPFDRLDADRIASLEKKLISVEDEIKNCREKMQEAKEELANAMLVRLHPSLVSADFWQSPDPTQEYTNDLVYETLSDFAATGDEEAKKLVVTLNKYPRGKITGAQIIKFAEFIEEHGNDEQKETLQKIRAGEITVVEDHEQVIELDFGVENQELVKLPENEEIYSDAHLGKIKLTSSFIYIEEGSDSNFRKINIENGEEGSTDDMNRSWYLTDDEGTSSGVSSPEVTSAESADELSEIENTFSRDISLAKSLSESWIFTPKVKKVVEEIEQEDDKEMKEFFKI